MKTNDIYHTKFVLFQTINASNFSCEWKFTASNLSKTILCHMRSFMTWNLIIAPLLGGRWGNDTFCVCNCSLQCALASCMRWFAVAIWDSVVKKLLNHRDINVKKVAWIVLHWCIADSTLYKKTQRTKSDSQQRAILFYCESQHRHLTMTSKNSNCH